MILLKLKRYIKQHQRVTLKDIQAHFDLSEEAALGLLHPLLQQGHVIMANTVSSCQSQTCTTNCAHSTQTPTTTYQWSSSPKKQISIPVQPLLHPKN